ncbi:MAG TPA: ribonuclease Y [Candidatus Polarisedimenticolia bacterium]|jgi:ribonuclease Y|nr:ribonuclease Y [Candidatus Polarisedimenticolia bacterium]
MTSVLIVVAALAALCGTAGGLTLRSCRRALQRAQERAGAAEADAETRVRLRLKEADLEIEERRAAAEAEAERKGQRRREELRTQEDRVRDQERNLQRRLQLLGQKERDVERREGAVKDRESAAAEREREAASALQRQRQALERIAGLTAAQARQELVHQIESEARQEAALSVRRIEEEARDGALASARRLTAEAVQRLPTGAIVDNVVTVVQLPSEEMKGRIIGREGRNIRALEMATGVDLIVDETPQAIVLSCYDSFRRAVAQTALDRLIQDGRIHPARIEEVVLKTRSDLEEGLEAAGESAAFDLGLTGLPPRLTRLLGRLRYRVVSGYNLLAHSTTVARLAQQMSTLLGARSDVALRAGLLHEIGHAEEATDGGPHPWILSADLAARSGEDPRVVQAIRSLAASETAPSVEAVLLQVAERAVVARPGERDDNLDVFIERLRRIEEIGASFSGVARVFAMRAGKEVRVIVEPASVNDTEVAWLSKDISRRIAAEVQFPGTVRVSVIRETRAVDYAT